MIEDSTAGASAIENSPQISESTRQPKRQLGEINVEGRQNPEDSVCPSKRLRSSRVSRACDQCRSKKDKCDGLQPTCSTCALLNRSCSYKSSPKKRGVPTGYIRTLELLWGIIFSEVKGSEHVAHVLFRTKNIPNHLANMSRDGESANKYLSAWKNSVVLKDIEGLLDQPEGDPNTMNFDGNERDPPRSAEISGMLTPKLFEWHVSGDPQHYQDEMISHRPILKHSTTTVLDIPRSYTPKSRACGTQTDPEKPFLAKAPADNTAMTQPMKYQKLGCSQSFSASPLHLPSNAWRLFDIYFSYTHCWLPIIEKHDILRTAFRYNEKDLHISLTKSGSGDHAAMWAVLAMAAIQDASVTHRYNDGEYRGDCLGPDDLYGIARSLIPSEEVGFEIGHVQGLLILSLIKFGRQDWTAAWILVGHATRMSLCLGLDHSPSAKTHIMTKKSSSRGKHVFLGCIALETLISTQTGRLPQLRKDHIAKIGFLEEDGLDEWQPWENLSDFLPEKEPHRSFHRGPLYALSTFNRLISLLSILNDLCCCKDKKETKVSELRLIDQQLQLWIANLPKACQIDKAALQTLQVPPHLLGLHLAYESTVIAFYLRVNSLETNIGSNSEREYRRIVVDGSKRIADLIDLYTDTYSISATSPIFGTYVNMASSKSRDQDGCLLSKLNFDQDLKFTSLSSRLGLLWTQKISLRPEADSNSRATRAKSPQVPPLIDRSNQLRPSELSDQNAANSMLHSNLSLPRTPSYSFRDLEQQICLPKGDISRSGKAAALGVESGAFVSHHTSGSSAPQREISSEPANVSEVSIGSQFQPTNPSAASSGSNRMVDPDCRPLLHPTNFRFQQSYDSTLASTGLRNVNNTGYAHQQLANVPNLDALFDELTSLDGVDKYVSLYLRERVVAHIAYAQLLRLENQPEFMQNLGFAPSTGVSEVLSYYSQLDPMIMPQTQRFPSLGSSSQWWPLSTSTADPRTSGGIERL
jgi:hypothetical protein